MEQAQVDKIVRAVLARMQEKAECAGTVPVEASARHVHLSKEDCLSLLDFKELPRLRDISQPGQYLSDCRVRLIGPKGTIEGVAVLGPARATTQVELSATDARALGVDAPLRLSGDLRGAANVFLQAGDRMIERRAAIVAHRHIHLPLADARALGLQDGQRVSVRVAGARPVTLEDVIVRAADPSAPRLHIDTDEANAAGAGRDTVATLFCAALDSEPERAEAPEPARIQACAEAQGKLISEREAAALVKKGVREILIRRGQIVTPLARDVLRAGGVAVRQEGSK